MRVAQERMRAKREQLESMPERIARIEAMVQQILSNQQEMMKSK